MGVYKYDSTNDELNPIAGSTTYADLAVGSIIPYGGTTPPISFLLCDGLEIPKADYPELYAVIGDAFGSAAEATYFKLPDLRECVPVGAGKNITKSIANHDRYNLGQFKDDELGTHDHPLKTVTTATYNTAGVPVGVAVNNTPTSATHGKQVGVNYIIKAKNTGYPSDIGDAVENLVEDLMDDYQTKDLATPITIGGTSQTTVEGALGALENIAKVGGASTEMTQLTNEDLNDITTEGWYFTSGTDSLTNKPTGVTVNNNIIHVIKRGSMSYVCQYFYCSNERKVYFRFSESGQWTLWRTIIDDSMLTSTVTSGSTAPITSGGVYGAMTNLMKLKEQKVNDTTTQYSFNNSYSVYLVQLASANAHITQYVAYKAQGTLKFWGINMNSQIGVFTVLVDLTNGNFRGEVFDTYDTQYGVTVKIYAIL